MVKQEYEAQVKFDDNVNPLVNQGALWKAGDIVDIHPKGWIWSKAEREHFLIINFGLLEESEAKAMLEEVVAICDVDAEGIALEEHMISSKLIARSRYKVDVTKLLDELPSKLVSDVYNRDIEAQPFQESAIKISDDVEDITLRPEIQQTILDAIDTLQKVGK